MIDHLSLGGQSGSLKGQTIHQSICVADNFLIRDPRIFWIFVQSGNDVNLTRVGIDVIRGSDYVMWREISHTALKVSWYRTFSRIYKDNIAFPSIKHIWLMNGSPCIWHEHRLRRDAKVMNMYIYIYIYIYIYLYVHAHCNLSIIYFYWITDYIRTACALSVMCFRSKRRVRHSLIVRIDDMSNVSAWNYE